MKDIAYKIIIASAAMVFLGILIGTFVQYAIYLASLGALLFLIGIILFIYSELKGEKNGKDVRKEEGKVEKQETSE